MSGAREENVTMTQEKKEKLRKKKLEGARERKRSEYDNVTEKKEGKK